MEDPAFPRRPGETRRQGLGVFRGRPAVDRTRPRARASITQPTCCRNCPPTSAGGSIRSACCRPASVDCHVHYPQLGVIASYGTQLLDSLKTHTFPAEQRFADAGHAAAQAELFLDELLRHGTTTALVFGTVHAVSAEAFLPGRAEAPPRG
ncbi:hypothetical protein ACPA9J_15450 [Pseudomonas aeruginosa]